MRDVPELSSPFPTRASERFPLNYGRSIHLQILEEGAHSRVRLHLPVNVLENFKRRFTGMLALIGAEGTYTLQLNPESGAYETQVPASEASLAVSINRSRFGKIERDEKGAYRYASLRKLSVFETRSIGVNPALGLPKSYLASKPLIKAALPLTDLHTHLSGELRGDALIAIAEALTPDQGGPLYYPTHLLSFMGLEPGRDYATDEMKDITRFVFGPFAYLEKPDAPAMEPAVPLTALKPHAKEMLRAHLSAPIDRQSSFEYIFMLREPFTKNKALFAPMLHAIGRQCQEEGLKYSELSSSSVITDPDWLEIIHREAPKIEAETGVKLRFIYGVPRNVHPDKMEDMIERAKGAMASPYITGFDWIGAETNKTREMEKQLRHVAAWIRKQKTLHGYDLEFRIHAAETSKNPDNAYEAMVIADEEKVGIRIGHFLHGMSEKSVALAQKMGAEGRLIIEYNVDSNLTNNDADRHSDVHIGDALAMGLPSVLGSDGRGLYDTSAQEMVINAQYAGVTPEGFKRIRALEEEYIAEQDITFAHKQEAMIREYDSEQGFLDAFRARVPEQRYTPERVTQIRQEEAEATEHFLKQARAMGIKALALEALDHAPELAGKTPILIGGAGGSNWEKVPEKAQRECRRGLEVLVAEAARDGKTYFVIGRHKAEGVTGLLAEVLDAHEKNGGEPIPMVAMLSEPHRRTHQHNPKLTHLTTLPGVLMEVPTHMISWLKAHDGLAYFFGGNTFTRGFILQCQTSDVPFAMMRSIPGATQQKGNALPGSYSFDTAVELGRRLPRDIAEARGETATFDHAVKVRQQPAACIGK